MSLAWWQSPQGKNLIERTLPSLDANVGRLAAVLEKLEPQADLKAENILLKEQVQALEFQLNMMTRKNDAAETKMIELEGQLSDVTKQQAADRWGAKDNK